MLQPNFSHKKVLIINREEITNSLIRRYLLDAGFEDIELEMDGLAGWTKVQTGEFDFVVMNWGATGLPGLAFLNRLRSDPNLGTVAFVAFSPKLDNDDFALIAEMPCAVLVEKPLNQSGFLKKLTDVWRESAEYSTHRNKIGDFLKACSDNDRNQAMVLFNKLIAKLSNPIPLTILAAKLFRERGFLKEAENLLRTAFLVDQRQIAIMAELGKVLVSAGRPKEAMKVLKNAAEYSPKNVERLLMMGELSLRELDAQKAGEHFRSVLKIDPQDQKGYHGLVLAKNMGEYLEMSKGQAITQNFAGVLNVIGISMVRGGRHDEGIQQYQSALKFVDSREDQARLSFNVGLGFFRAGREQEALPWFQIAMKEGSPVANKAGDYVNKIENSTGSEERDQSKAKALVSEASTNKKPKDAALYEPIAEKKPRENLGDFLLPADKSKVPAESSPPKNLEDFANEEFDDDPLMLPTSLSR